MSSETLFNDDAQQWETMTSRRNRKSAKKEVAKKSSYPVAGRMSMKSDDKKKRMRGGRSARKSEFDPLALYVLSLLTPFVAESIGKKPQYERAAEQQQREQERQLDLPLSRGHNNNNNACNNNQGTNVDRWMVFSSSFDRSSGRGLDKQDYLSFIRPTEYSFASYNDFLRCWQSALIDAVPQSTSVHVFKEGIQPLWEHPQNIKGGKFSIPCGEGRDHAISTFLKVLVGVTTGVIGKPSDVTGVVLSFREWGGTVSIWNSNAADRKQVDRIREDLNRVVPQKHSCYQSHQRSIKVNTFHLNKQDRQRYSRPQRRQQQDRNDSNNNRSTDLWERGSSCHSTNAVVVEAEPVDDNNDNGVVSYSTEEERDVAWNEDGDDSSSASPSDTEEEDVKTSDAESCSESEPDSSSTTPPTDSVVESIEEEVVDIVIPSTPAIASVVEEQQATTASTTNSGWGWKVWTSAACSVAVAVIGYTLM